MNRFSHIFGFLIFGTYIVLAVSSAFSSGPVWDDEIEYIGLIDQISFAKNLVFSNENSNLDYESAIATNLEFYGIINKLSGLLVYRIVSALLGAIATHDLSDEFLGTVLINKFATVSLFIGCIYLTYLVGKGLGLKNAILAPMLLIGFPTIVGHSWLNVKDIPFAFSYTLFTLAGVYYSTQARSSYWQERKFVSRDYRLLSSRVFFAFCGSLTVACRPAFMPLAIITMMICIVIRACQNRMNISNMLISLMETSGLLLVLSSALIPASWVNPFEYFAKSIQVHSRHPWGGCMLMHGECRSVSTSYTTGKYIADWLLIKLPLVHLGIIVCAVLAATLLSLLYLKRLLSISSNRSNINLLDPRVGARTVVYLQAFALPAIAVINNSNTYDGLRHWLFCFPALFIICIDLLEMASVEVYSLIKNNILLERLGILLLCIGVILPIVDAAKLAPYSYAYINEISRHKFDHRNIDLDYWGASSKAIATEIHKRGWHISNILDNGSAEHVVYQKLYLIDNQFPKKDKVPVTAIVHKRFAAESQRLDQKACDDKFYITRNLIFGRPLNIAAVGLNCKAQVTS